MAHGKGKKHMAFPVLEHGDLYLSQTPVICQYLGKKLDGGRLYPKTEQNRIQAEIVMAGIVDWVDDGLFQFFNWDKGIYLLEFALGRCWV